MSSLKFTYICSECGTGYEISPKIMLCPKCSQKQEKEKPLRGILEVRLDGKINGNIDIFDLLPIEREFFPKIPVGNTPLWTPQNLRRAMGFSNLFIKDDTLNPTGSLKDRASFLVAAFAKKFGIKDIVVASTGNAASSMAGIGAAAGLNVTIFVPKNAPKAKMIQALQYGAEVIPVDGNYDMAYELSLQYSMKKGALSRNTAYNPMTIEGKKTVAVEIFIQLGKVPDYIFVPVGDGVILGGVYKGFLDLKRLGIVDRIPIIYAVQASGSDAICRAFRAGDFEKKKTAHTIADSICVDVPRNGYYAVKQLRENGGGCVCVTDDEILLAQKMLSSTAGLFSEPAGAASLAGFIASKEKISSEKSVVILVTGNGLKDIDSAAKKIELPERAISSIEEL